MAALVRLVSRVGANVLLQVTELRELALADLAAVRFDAQMDARVLRQVRTVGERLRALRTFVRLGFAHVDLRVKLQVGLRPENLLIQKKKKNSISKHRFRLFISLGIYFLMLF